MFLRKLNQKIDKISKTLEKSNIIELSYVIGSKKEILKRNLIAGIARGVGIGIGVTIITAIIIYLLRRLITLNIPVIGDYIADIVEIVERSKWLGAVPMRHFVAQGHVFKKSKNYCIFFPFIVK